MKGGGGERVMEAGRPSRLVISLILILHLIAFALAIAAERRRSTGKVVPDKYDEATYCVYDSDIATGLGLGAFFAVLLAQGLLMSVIKCLCCGRGLTPGGPRTKAIIFFVIYWLMAASAELCLVAGAARNAYHTKYSGVFGVWNPSCAALRKGVFEAAAGLVAVALLAAELCYTCYVRAASNGFWQAYKGDGERSVGMAGYQG
ncbi:uncharacterized protein LOC18445597 [Amborella trichopoda]|uniref:Fiber protein Fb34 n=1 Tax=Amborella trichopoda TaxID=13333 RepID=U5DA43_AMBTC|nr:uncharacterized protein LOC18445597 [Amborella trichopoda]ERN17263.1 hypothetical protein AMTR_s00044p00216680 [Amborella trichopoda]|eukprot:XP_006855796.1 uncharacterized protein LOC18445597 [Amborella trichopoda]